MESAPENKGIVTYIDCDWTIWGIYMDHGYKERGIELGWARGGRVTHLVLEEPQLGHRKCHPEVARETTGI